MAHTEERSVMVKQKMFQDLAEDGCKSYCLVILATGCVFGTLGNRG